MKEKKIATIYALFIVGGSCGRDRMDLLIPMAMQPMLITTYIVSSNPAQVRCT